MLCFGSIRLFYSCEVRSATTIPPIKNLPFQSTNDLAPLVESGFYRLMNNIKRDPSIITLNNFTEQKFKKGLQKFGFVYDSKASYEPLILGENILFPTFDIFVETDWLNIPFRDQLTTINEKVQPTMLYAYYLQSNNPLREKLNYALSKGLEMVPAIRKRYLWKSHLITPKTQTLEILSLRNLLAIFRIFGFALVASLLVLFCEIFYFKFCFSRKSFNLQK